MNRLTRRVFALVAITGGGVVGAAPNVLADPPDAPGTAAAAPDGVAATAGPTTATSPTVTSPATPVPAPVPVRSGRAPDGATPPLPQPVAGAGTDSAAASVTVRTGLAADLGGQLAGVLGGRAPTPAAAAPGSGSARPATPAPAPVGPPTRVPASTPPAPGSDAAAGGRPASTANVPAGAAPSPPASTTYVIAAGDNLWDVAASHLAAVTGRPVGSVPDAEVTPYWQRVCDANRARVRSGDVSLVFPGEQIELPPVV